MRTNETTRPKLLGINHEGAVKVEHKPSGVAWKVQPENFDTFVQEFNLGTAHEWVITPLNPEAGDHGLPEW